MIIAVYYRMSKIGFGGSCHWCTEAVFQSLRGVTEVQQGWIATDDRPEEQSEAVIVYYDPQEIPLSTLIAVHLHTHSCTSVHSMRSKYRSAVYCFDDIDRGVASEAIIALQADFDQPVITEVLPFRSFRLNKEEYLNYYYSNPEKPFCQTFINPKLQLLMQRFKGNVKADEVMLGAD